MTTELNTIRKIFYVLKEGEKLTAVEIKNRVIDIFNNRKYCPVIFNRVKMQLTLLPRNGYMNKELINGTYVYSKNENTQYYSETHRRPEETITKQIACFCGDYLICSKNVINTSDLQRYKRMCEENFANIRFEEYNKCDTIPIKYVPKTADYPRKTKAAQNRVAVNKTSKAVEWYAVRTLSHIETLSKQLNTPLPKTKEQIVEFYNKAIQI